MNKEDELALAKIYLELLKLQNRLYCARMERERLYQEARKARSRG